MNCDMFVKCLGSIQLSDFEAYINGLSGGFSTQVMQHTVRTVIAAARQADRGATVSVRRVVHSGKKSMQPILPKGKSFHCNSNTISLL
jgi:hypothetical protein